MDRNSVRAYVKHKNSGRLSKARLEALRGIAKHGPCTAQELIAATGYANADKRCSELLESGHIIRKRSRQCTATGETAWEWEINQDPNFDGTLPAKKTSLAARLAALEERFDALEQRVAEAMKESQSPIITLTQGNLLP